MKYNPDEYIPFSDWPGEISIRWPMFKTKGCGGTLQPIENNEFDERLIRNKSSIFCNFDSMSLALCLVEAVCDLETALEIKDFYSDGQIECEIRALQYIGFSFDQAAEIIREERDDSENFALDLILGYAGFDLLWIPS